jgi:hypothetical protein
MLTKRGHQSPVSSNGIVPSAALARNRSYDRPSRACRPPHQYPLLPTLSVKPYEFHVAVAASFIQMSKHHVSRIGSG